MGKQPAGEADRISRDSDSWTKCHRVLGLQCLGDCPFIKRQAPIWPLSDEERAEIERIFATEDARKLVTALRSRKDDARVEVLDAAYWMKGCSSLGRLRYAVLVGVGKRSDRSICFLDFKEAVTAAAPRAAGVSMPSNDAERVVRGAVALSPNLGERMLKPQPLRVEQRRVGFVRGGKVRVDGGEVGGVETLERDVIRARRPLKRCAANDVALEHDKVRGGKALLL
jgi:hypothetical protein